MRAKIRQEFERNRYVKQLPVVDMLIAKSNMEYQETMNYWKQIAQLMKYFRSEEDPRTQVSKDFMTNFLEVRVTDERGGGRDGWLMEDVSTGSQLELRNDGVAGVIDPSFLRVCWGAVGMERVEGCVCGCLQVEIECRFLRTKKTLFQLFVLYFAPQPPEIATQREREKDENCTHSKERDTHNPSLLLTGTINSCRRRPARQ